MDHESFEYIKQTRRIGIGRAVPTAANRWVLPFVCATAFAVAFNGTMLPVALPEIGRALSLDPARLGWVITGYFLLTGVTIPFFGRLADLYGVNRLYAAGLFAFFLGSVGCGLAPGYPTLMVGRVVQGVGAAAVVALGPTAVSLAYAPERRGSAIGMIGAAVGVGITLGPVAGGLITDSLGWRYLFSAGALFGALALFARKALPRGEVAAGGGFDWPGGLLVGVALGGGLLALTKGAEKGWGASSVALSVLVATFALVGLVVRQRTARSPFVPRLLLGNHPYVWLGAITLLLIGINITVEVALPLLLADANDLPARLVGLALLPAALATIASGPLAGRLADRVGILTPMRTGVGAVIVALFLLSGFGVGGPAWVASALVAVVSAGATFAKTAITTGVSLAVPKESLPSGVSINETVWILGVSAGTALFTATLSARSGTEAALNPLHAGPAAGYSDAFLLLAVPLSMVLLASPKLTKIGRGLERVLVPIARSSSHGAHRPGRHAR